MSVVRKLGAAAAGALLALTLAGVSAAPASADTSWGYSAPVDRDPGEQVKPSRPGRGR